MFPADASFGLRLRAEAPVAIPIHRIFVETVIHLAPPRQPVPCGNLLGRHVIGVVFGVLEAGGYWRRLHGLLRIENIHDLLEAEIGVDLMRWNRQVKFATMLRIKFKWFNAGNGFRNDGDVAKLDKVGFHGRDVLKFLAVFVLPRAVVRMLCLNRPLDVDSKAAALIQGANHDVGVLFFGARQRRQPKRQHLSVLSQRLSSFPARSASCSSLTSS